MGRTCKVPNGLELRTCLPKGSYLLDVVSRKDLSHVYGRNLPLFPDEPRHHVRIATSTLSCSWPRNLRHHIPSLPHPDRDHLKHLLLHDGSIPYPPHLAHRRGFHSLAGAAPILSLLAVRRPSMDGWAEGRWRNAIRTIWETALLAILLTSVLTWMWPPLRFVAGWLPGPGGK